MRECYIRIIPTLQSTEITNCYIEKTHNLRQYTSLTCRRWN